MSHFGFLQHGLRERFDGSGAAGIAEIVKALNVHQKAMSNKFRLVVIPSTVFRNIIKRVLD